MEQQERRLQKMRELRKEDPQKYNRIVGRLRYGAMTKYEVDGWLAYDMDEYDNFVAKKAGRKIKF